MENNRNTAVDRQSLKDKLETIILIESSKSYEEMDSDLVKECVDFLMELEGKESLSKEEIQKRVNEIPFWGKAEAVGIYAKKKLRAKRIALIAAVMALIIAIFGIIAIGSGDASDELVRKLTWEDMKDWLPGATKDFDNITVYKADEARIYSSIEEFAKSEEIEILYPTWLPEDEKIVGILYILQNGAEKYQLYCNNPYYGINIDIKGELKENIKTACSKKEIAGLTVYYTRTPEFMQADFVYGGNHYAVTAYTEDDLFRIIENLKEIK